MESSWRDGFLFVGNQLSLDFLNTLPVVDGSARELLPDAASLWRWLAAAGLPMAKTTAPTLPDDEAALRKLREFREEYREVILAAEAGQAPSQSFLQHLNALLRQYSFTDEVLQTDSGLARRRRYQTLRLMDAFYPILDAVADLLTKSDFTRIRKCDNCVLHFLDTSKKGTRRWCSMQLCGNRTKVAAYAKRHRV